MHKIYQILYIPSTHKIQKNRDPFPKSDSFQAMKAANANPVDALRDE